MTCSCSDGDIWVAAGKISGGLLVDKIAEMFPDLKIKKNKFPATLQHYLHLTIPTYLMVNSPFKGWVTGKQMLD